MGVARFLGGVVEEFVEFCAQDLIIFREAADALEIDISLKVTFDVDALAGSRQSG